jgi:hypothetical protein
MTRTALLLSLLVLGTATRSEAQGFSFNSSPTLDALAVAGGVLEVSTSLTPLVLNTVSLVQLGQGVPLNRAVLITGLVIALAGAGLDTVNLVGSTHADGPLGQIALGSKIGLNVASAALNTVLLLLPRTRVMVVPTVTSAGAGASLSFRF